MLGLCYLLGFRRMRILRLFGLLFVLFVFALIFCHFGFCELVFFTLFKLRQNLLGGIVAIVLVFRILPHDMRIWEQAHTRLILVLVVDFA